MMKKPENVIARVALVVQLILPCSGVGAATDGVYTLAETAAVWDVTEANRLKGMSPDYAYTYGDESSVTYLLPWNFNFYGQSYAQITADTNGNIWFSASGSAHSFNLAANGRGPVIAVWNNDLSSYLYGGVFIQHLSNPERVVVEWQTETYTDEGFHLPNRFEAVLYQNGSIRLNYGSFTPSTFKDFGSGISRDNGTNFINLSNSYGSPFSLAGRSFGIGPVATPAVTIDAIIPPTTSNTRLTGSMQVGSSITVTSDTGAIIGQITYPTPTTWTVDLSGLPAGDTIVSVTATSPTGVVTVSNVTVTSAQGGNSVPVPALGPFGVVAAVAGLMWLTFTGRNRRRTE
jgi:hypothetical protein